MVSGKEEILNENEWNNIYLYTLILIPLIFAYLVNKYKVPLKYLCERYGIDISEAKEVLAKNS